MARSSALRRDNVVGFHAMSRHSSPSSASVRRRLPRWLKVTVISALVLANLVVFGVWWTIHSADKAFRDNAAVRDDVVSELAAAPADSADPLYVLLIGTDSRAGVDKSVFGDFAGARGDVIMIARLDPGEGKVALLSIPRDTYVPIEGHGENKINAAYAYGDAPLMVKTVRQAFDIPLNHYVEIDFAGFQDLVDELGGVEMRFSNPARDLKSKLDVPAGDMMLNGFQALAYARSRHYQEQRDGSWRSVDASDIGRTARQQQLVLAILSRLKRPSTLADTGSVVASLARHMTVDSALADSSLVRLAFSMRDVGVSDIETATLPTVGATRGKASVQLIDHPAADPMVAAFRSGQPMDTTEAGGIVTVDVLNGNGVAGNAGSWADRLTSAGYVVKRVADADHHVTTTEVVVAAPDPGADDLVDELGFGHV
ncbi:MAG: LCP family protein, partial [Acidimicrobiia bacterium]